MQYAHPRVVQAVSATALMARVGTPTPYETNLAKKIVEMVPSVEKVRMVSSGTEATMSAIRVARGLGTRKDYKI